jgi:hypothetical protein
MQPNKIPCIGPIAAAWSAAGHSAVPQHNVAGDGATTVVGEYLAVHARVA